MSEQQPPKDIYHPIYPIPIISTPQPLVCTANKLSQLQPKEELEIYKRQYNRLVKENNILLANLAKVTQEKQALQAKYNNIHVERESNDEKRKRVRRTAGQIVRQFDCCMEKCGKSYGTEASLVQHIKLKHPEIYATILRKRIDSKGEKATHGISPEINANSQS